MVLDVEQQRVAAAGEQAQKGRFGCIGLEEERGDVTVQVVDGDQRQPAGPGERLRRREDEERADQPGPTRDRDPRHVVSDVRLGQSLADDRDDELEMFRDATSGTTPP